MFSTVQYSLVEFAYSYNGNACRSCYHHILSYNAKYVVCQSSRSCPRENRYSIPVTPVSLCSPYSSPSTPFLIQKLSHHLIQFPISTSNIHRMMTIISSHFIFSASKEKRKKRERGAYLSVNILNLNPLTFS